MKKRVLGAALFGTGLFLLVGAACLALLLVPSLAKIPFDFVPPTTVVAAHDATFATSKVTGSNTVAEIDHADLETTTGIKPDPAAAADILGSFQNKAIVWNVFSQTKRVDTGDVINASTGRIAMDRSKGSAVPWSGQCYADQLGQSCNAGNITYTGLLYQFPFGTQKQTYEYFDTTLHTALPMKYQGTETVKGLTTYRFQQVVPAQQISMDAGTVSFLTSQLAPKATTSSVWYTDTRTLWVEPDTGSIVNYREQQHRELRTDAGEPITIFDATFEYTPQTLSDVVKAASDGRSQLQLLGTYLPIAGVLLGLVLMVLGFFLTRAAVREQQLASARTQYIERQRDGDDEDAEHATTVT